jgi:integrase/recombinase XerD
MIELLYATGLRVSELVGVRAADLHLDEQYLTCTEGHKERIVRSAKQAPLDPPYQERAPGCSRANAHALFVNARGRRADRVGFWKILEQHPARPAAD